MSALDPSPNINATDTSSGQLQPDPEKLHPRKETTSKTSVAFTEQIKLQLKERALATFGPVLVIISVTIVFIMALLADTLILAIINWSFGSIVNKYPFAAKILEGIQLLSALGIAVAYILYLIRSLFKDTRHLLDEIKKDSIEEEKSL